MTNKCNICGKQDVSDMKRHLWDSHGVHEIPVVEKRIVEEHKYEKKKTNLMEAD